MFILAIFTQIISIFETGLIIYIMRHIIVAILFAFTLCLPLHAIQETLSFIPFSLNEGLTHTRVQCIFCDHAGIVWIGTKNGLNSWDQSELKNYLHNPSDPKSLPDNYIKFITEGADQKLYLSTNHGVGTFDPALKQFSPLLYEGKPFEAWSCLHTDSVLLLGGRNTIYSYHYQSRSLAPLINEVKGDLNKCITHIALWDDQTYIASCKHDGIWIYDLKRQTMSRCPFVQKHNVNSIFVDSQKRLYVSVYGNGVFRYRHDGTPDGHFSVQNGKLTHNVVSDFVEKDSIIWMGTDGGGINLLDLHTDEVKCIKHIPSDPLSLPNNSIFCLYKDRKGNIWGGSVHAGLFAIIKNHIKTYKDTPPNVPYGLSEPTITALHEEADTLLWIGTDGGGLNAYDQHTTLFRHFPSTSGKKVVSIVSFSPDKLLISCFNDGFYLFDKRTAQITPYPLIDSHTAREEFAKGDLVNLYATPDEIYIFGYHIYIYNRHTHETYRLSTPPNVENYQLMNAQPVHEDDRYIYIMSYKELLQIEKASKSITLLFSVSGNESLTSACIDSQGNFWIGSDYALYYYDTASKLSEKVQNILFQNIQSLTSDSKERIWIGANNMLLVYFIHEKRTMILDETDGVKPNEYIFTPMPRSLSQNIYMGGTQGLTVINQNIEIVDDYAPAVNLLSINLDGKDITRDVLPHRKLVVPYQHSSINFKVIVDESVPFCKHLFNYILEGDEPRKIQSASRSVELGHLNPGNYTLLANCNTNNNWSKPMELLHIHVQAPIWQRPWFIGLCLLIFIMLFTGGIWLLQKRMAHKYKLLIAKNEREQEERLHFIARLNEVIDNNIDNPNLDNHFLQNEMAMGRTSLYNKLKQATGMGTSEYINHRKIEKAKKLLTNTNLSISEISDCLGFTYQRYFSTIFKKTTGLSPSQFRHQSSLK